MCKRKPMQQRVRHVIARHPNILAFLVGCLLVVVLFGGLETFLRVRVWLATEPGEGPARSNLYDMVEAHPVLGYRAKTSTTLTELLTRGGKVIYTADYDIDAHSQRVTPFSHDDAEHDCAAVFLGCSMTFGLGVENADTLPAQFAARTTGYWPVNAGFPGYGLQQVWLHLTDAAFFANIPFDEGVVIYTFIDDHINRLAGVPAVLTGWNYALPWLVEKEDQIEHSGTFATRNPLQYYIYRYGGRLHLYRFFESRVSRPTSTTAYTPDMLDLAARVIVDGAEKLRDLRPGFQLWVLFFPGTALSAEMQERLESTGVQCLDYSELLNDTDIPDERLWHKDSAGAEWGHPKAEVYAVVAEQMTADIPDCE